MSTENTERQTRFRERRRARGITQITVWAPERDRDRLKNYAARLVKTFEKEQQGEAKEANSEG